MSPEFLINGFLTTKRTLKSRFQVDVWVENTFIYSPCIPINCSVTLGYLKLSTEMGGLGSHWFRKGTYVLVELGCWWRGWQHRRKRDPGDVSSRSLSSRSLASAPGALHWVLIAMVWCRDGFKQLDESCLCNSGASILFQEKRLFLCFHLWKLTQLEPSQPPQPHFNLLSYCNKVTCVKYAICGQYGNWYESI